MSVKGPARVVELGRRLETWVVVAAVLPVLVAVARKRGDRWIPIGDNALIELRSRDVFSWQHFPFLGTWSSASLTAGKDLNHPGPLLFDLLAIPVRLFGGSTGVAVGVGLINAACIVGVAIVGHRLRGRTGAITATGVAAMLAWTMGSAMLTDPWNPHVLMLPCLLMLVLVWGVASGDLVLLPWLLAVGSLCLQTHLGYVYLVPALCVAAIAGAGVVFRRRWRLDPATVRDDRPRIRRTGLVSVGTVLVLWAQPLWEQIAGTGQGNLARIATSTGGDEPTIGAELGTRIVAQLVAVPPWWSRSSFVDAVPYTQYEPDGVTVVPVGLPGTAVALLGVAVVLIVLAGVAWWSRRRHDRVGLIAAVVAGIGVVLALGSLTLMPIGPLGLTPHQMRWSWPIAAFVLLAVVLAVVAPLRHRAVPVGAAVVAVAFSVLNLPAHVQPAGPDTFQESISVAVELSQQVREYRSDRAVWFDTRGLRYLEPYSAAVMSALQQADVDFRVDEPGLVRQVGDARRSTGDEGVRLYLREGREALTVAAGAERIAFTSPLMPAEIDELLAGEAAMVDEIALMGVVLSPSGADAAAAGSFGLTVDEILQASFDAPAFVGSGLAARLVTAGALELDPAVSASFVRTSELRNRAGTTTVAVFVEPA